jgi:hypothetical protein
MTIAELKLQILKARRSNDIKKELRLSAILAQKQGDKKIMTMEQAYGQMADSP